MLKSMYNLFFRYSREKCIFRVTFILQPLIAKAFKRFAVSKKIFGCIKGYDKCWFNASEITTICKLAQDKVLVIIITKFERERERKK